MNIEDLKSKLDMQKEFIDGRYAQTLLEIKEKIEKSPLNEKKKGLLNTLCYLISELKFGSIASGVSNYKSHIKLEDHDYGLMDNEDKIAGQNRINDKSLTNMAILICILDNLIEKKDILYLIEHDEVDFSIERPSPLTNFLEKLILEV